jgi:hypothetical protein
LVGDSDGGDFAGIDGGLGNGLAGGGGNRLPDFVGIVLDTPRFGKMLGEFLLGDRQGFESLVVNDRSRTGGALIESEKVFHGKIRLWDL